VARRSNTNSLAFHDPYEAEQSYLALPSLPAMRSYDILQRFPLFQRGSTRSVFSGSAAPQNPRGSGGNCYHSDWRRG